MSKKPFILKGLKYWWKMKDWEGKNLALSTEAEGHKCASGECQRIRLNALIKSMETFFFFFNFLSGFVGNCNKVTLCSDFNLQAVCYFWIMNNFNYICGLKHNHGCHCFIFIYLFRLYCTFSAMKKNRSVTCNNGLLPDLNQQHCKYISCVIMTQLWGCSSYCFSFYLGVIVSLSGVSVQSNFWPQMYQFHERIVIHYFSFAPCCV